MHIAYRCPTCERPQTQELAAVAASLRCPGCASAIEPPPGAVEDGRLTRCLVCPSTDLFVRKAFPQGWGLAITVAGFVASSVAWYYGEVFWTFAILFTVALCDAAIWFAIGDCLVCYRCGAQYRGWQGPQPHTAFDLETHERYRQLAARTAAAKEQSI